MARIVFQIVVGTECPRQVEIFNQHAFLVEVGDAHRTLQLLHALLASPLLYSGYQGTRYCEIIDELNHRETDVFDLPALVSPAVDNAHNATYGLLVTIGYKALDIRELQTGIFPGVEEIDGVRLPIGHILWASTVYAFRHTQEITHTALVAYGADGYVAACSHNCMAICYTF